MNAHDVHKRVRDLEQALKRNASELATAAPGGMPEISVEAYRIVGEACQLWFEHHRGTTGPHLRDIWDRALGQWRAALSECYPDGFDEGLKALRNGDTDGAEPVIALLEADPWFAGSGYAKEDAIRCLKRVKLSHEQAERLRSVVLRVVHDPGFRQEFAKYGVLAKSVDTPDLRKSLKAMTEMPDDAVRRRAQWVLDALDGIDPRRRHRAWYKSETDRMMEEWRTRHP
ncbi:MAG TPA: hypothetical protein VGM51_17160 [Armatimonadota bacterium]|jgi:hypothetical protein